MAFSQGFTAEVPISLSITSFIDKHSFLKRAHNSVSGRRKRTGVPGMRVSKCEDAEFERAICTTRMPAGRSCLSERHSPNYQNDCDENRHLKKPSRNRNQTLS